MDYINKLLYPGGFVIFSDSDEYEKGVIKEYLELDPVVQNIVFVYSQKNKVDWSGFFNQFDKFVHIVPFEEYNKIEYAGVIENMDRTKTLMIIKDVRFMEKRLDKRLSLMQITHTCYKKIVIDAYPYEVEKYKIYYPYSFFDKTLLGYSHSYAIERDIDNFELDDSLPNPFVIDDIVKKIAPATFINYSKLFNFKIVEHVHKVTEEQLNGYEELKEELFILYEAGKIGDKKLAQQLQKYSKSVLSEYSIPSDLKKVYKMKDEKEIHIHRTNLKVDENVIMPEFKALIEDENEFVKQLYEVVN